MAIGRKGETLQAVEICSSTTIGIVSGIEGRNKQIHAIDAGNITFTFRDVAPKVVAALAGSDWVSGSDCETITSVGQVIVT